MNRPLQNIGEHLLEAATLQANVETVESNGKMTTNDKHTIIYPTKVSEWMKVIVCLAKAKSPKHYTAIAVTCGISQENIATLCSTLVKKLILVKPEIGTFNVSHNYLKAVKAYYTYGKYLTLIQLLQESGVDIGYDAPQEEIKVAPPPPVESVDDTLNRLLKVKQEALPQVESRHSTLTNDLEQCSNELNKLKADIAKLEIALTA